MHVCISFLHFKFALADSLRPDTYCFHYFGFYVLLLIYLAYRRSFFKMSWYCGIFSQKSFHAQVSCNEIYLSWVCTVLIYRCSESMRVYIEELLLKVNRSFQISFIFPNCHRFFSAPSRRENWLTIYFDCICCTWYVNLDSFIFNYSALLFCLML